MPQQPKHIHRYKKKNLSNSSKPYLVWACTKIGCSHYLPKVLLKGKMAECSRCGDPFVITTDTLKLSELHCDDCTKRKNKKQLSKAQEFLDSLNLDNEV